MGPRFDIDVCKSVLISSGTAVEARTTKLETITVLYNTMDYHQSQQMWSIFQNGCNERVFKVAISMLWGIINSCPVPSSRAAVRYRKR
jgi:hypothetical protein